MKPDVAWKRTLRPKRRQIRNVRHVIRSQVGCNCNCESLETQIGNNMSDLAFGGLRSIICFDTGAKVA